MWDTSERGTGERNYTGTTTHPSPLQMLFVSFTIPVLWRTETREQGTNGKDGWGSWSVWGVTASRWTLPDCTQGVQVDPSRLWAPAYSADINLFHRKSSANSNTLQHPTRTEVVLTTGTFFSVTSSSVHSCVLLCRRAVGRVRVLFGFGPGV